MREGPEAFGNSLVKASKRLKVSKDETGSQLQDAAPYLLFAPCVGHARFTHQARSGHLTL
jgi:hypothetical protein